MVRILYPGLALALAAWGCLLAAGCGGYECGAGTVEKGGVCQAPDDYVKCGAGFKVSGNQCVPEDQWVKKYCDPTSTEYKQGKCVSAIACDATTELKNGKCVAKKAAVSVPDCTKKCGDASGSTICVSGRVYEGVGLVTSGPDSKDFIKPADGVEVKVYDPLAFVSSPSTAKPLATADIYNDGGCFIVSKVTIPFTGFLAIGIDDKATGQDVFDFTAIGHTPTSGVNSVDLVVPLIKKATTAAWNKELFGSTGKDMVKEGIMMAWYRDFKTGKSVAGVSPTLDGQSPPWQGYTARFFSADMSKSPHFDAKTTSTTAAGLVAVPGAPLKSYSGAKAGCTIDSGLGGSAPGALFFRIFNVSGC